MDSIKSDFDKKYWKGNFYMSDQVNEPDDRANAMAINAGLADRTKWNAIYEFVLNSHNINPNECLFIDDTKENTETAKTLGIHTWNIIPKKEDVVDLFQTKKALFQNSYYITQNF